MNFNEYQEACKRTFNNNLNHEESLANIGLGLAGESGEVCEPIKKHLFHGKPIDIEHMKKELGDVMFYVAWACNQFGFTMEEAAISNVEKLTKRWPNGFLNNNIKNECEHGTVGCPDIGEKHWCEKK